MAGEYNYYNPQGEMPTISWLNISGATTVSITEEQSPQTYIQRPKAKGFGIEIKSLQHVILLRLSGWRLPEVATYGVAFEAKLNRETENTIIKTDFCDSGGGASIRLTTQWQKVGFVTVVDANVSRRISRHEEFIDIEYVNAGGLQIGDVISVRKLTFVKGNTIPTLDEVQSAVKGMITLINVKDGKDGAQGAKGDQGVAGAKGADGRNGADGRGVASITQSYYLSTSKERQEGGAWQNTQPAWQKGKYLWTRTTYTYTDGAQPTTLLTCSTEWEATNEVAREIENYNYLKTLFEQSAGIKAGVVFGGALHAMEDGTVRSYLNGVKGRPALALGVQSYGTSAEKAFTEFNFDGSGHVGGLYFATDGTEPRLYIPGDDGTERVTFSNRAVPSIQALQGEALDKLSVSKKTYSVNIHDTTTYQNSSNGEIVEGPGQNTYLRTQGDRLRSMGANGTIRIRGRAEIYHRAYGEAKEINPGDGTSPYTEYHRHYADGEVWLCRGTGTRVSDVRRLCVLWGEYTTTQERRRSENVDATIQGLPADEYFIEVRGAGTYTNSGSYMRFELSEMMMSYDVVDRRTHVAGNGFASFYERGQWVHIENGKIQASGDTNLPGVLMSGEVRSSDGMGAVAKVQNLWGVYGLGKSIDVRHEGTGFYRVVHNLGRTNYTVQATLFENQQGARDTQKTKNISLWERNANDFVVLIRSDDLSGGHRMAESSFFFTIIGANF